MPDKALIAKAERLRALHVPGEPLVQCDPIQPIGFGPGELAGDHGERCRHEDTSEYERPGPHAPAFRQLRPVEVGAPAPDSAPLVVPDDLRAAS